MNELLMNELNNLDGIFITEQISDSINSRIESSHNFIKNNLSKFISKINIDEIDFKEKVVDAIIISGITNEEDKFNQIFEMFDIKEDKNLFNELNILSDLCPDKENILMNVTKELLKKDISMDGLETITGIDYDGNENFKQSDLDL